MDEGEGADTDMAMDLLDHVSQSERAAAPRSDMHQKGSVAAALLRQEPGWTIGAVDEVRRLCAVSGFDQEHTRRVVIELFSPPRVCSELDKRSEGPLSSGISSDFTVNTQTGEKWDFLSAVDRRACWKRLRVEDPWVVIGSPPCTDFCAFNVQWNFPRMDPEVVSRRKGIEGKQNLYRLIPG